MVGEKPAPKKGAHPGALKNLLSTTMLVILGTGLALMETADPSLNPPRR